MSTNLRWDSDSIDLNELEPLMWLWPETVVGDLVVGHEDEDGVSFFLIVTHDLGQSKGDASMFEELHLMRARYATDEEVRERIAR